MRGTSRRSVLGLVASVPVLALGELAPDSAAAADDSYLSNTELYADPAVVEGTDYARRFRRHGFLDDSLAQTGEIGQTAVIAPHGGGIEFGTSELCLAIAGYHPADLTPDPATGPGYDYWMFEGLRASNNGELHVTSTHCDDPVALSLCGGARRAVALHGCTPAQAGLPDGTEKVLVGGRDAALRALLVEEFGFAEIQAQDAAGHDGLDGDAIANIANRTLLGAGAQLEITTPLRLAMFGVNTRAQRKHTTLPVFRSFVGAVRKAIARAEAG